MGILDRFRRGTSGGSAHSSGQVDDAHLRSFVATRVGVEGFVEPRTTVTSVTLLLVAKDGEWTRRTVPSVQWAHHFCNKLQVPSYDAAVVGVPPRMREYNRRMKQAELDQLKDL